ncbi:MAG: family 43 glycosylhydrolase [Clostridia bacterium]|nr:family 43 glycosylhydrolase [Clostridia bacterium]
MNSIISSFTAIIMAALTFLGLVATPYDEPIDKINGGDPYIIEDESGCYYTFTTGGGIDIFQIESFDTINVTRQKTIFWAGEHGTDGDIWAPEIHKFGDRWYIVATAKFKPDAVPAGKMPYIIFNKNNDNGDYYRYSFVLESKTEDIFGEYEFKGIIAPDGLSNLDGTYLQKDGKLYFVCAAYMKVAYQSIYICEMENPYTLKTDKRGKHIIQKLSSPIYQWEKNGWDVNEGPAVLYKGDSIFIVYSASGYSSGKYCMGMLSYDGGNIMKKSSWDKSPVRVSYHNPIKEIYSAGHCSFIHRDNGEIYMVYHANKTQDFAESPRLTYIKKVEFAFGKPILM